MGTKVATIAAVDRTLATLEFLVDCKDGATLTEVANHINANKSITVRILASLERNGYVSKDQRTGSYRLTLKLVGLLNRYVGFLEIHDLSLPLLKELADSTKELVELAVVQNGTMVFATRVEGNTELPGLRVVSGIGQTIILHTMAAGKILLASLPEERFVQAIAEHGLFTRTPNSITNLEQLQRELKCVREKRFALNLEEDVLGVSAVAVPVEVRGHLVGAVVLAAPSYRADRTRLEALAPRLTEVAERISNIWPLDRLPITTSD